MKNLGEIIILLILFTTFSNYGQSKNFIDQPYLETTATFTQEIIPDRIYLSILITEKDTKGKIPVEVQEDKMIKKLKTLGIDTDKQLTVSDLSSNFQKHFLKKTDIVKSKSFTLLIYDGTTANKAFIALEEMNISNVSLDKTEYSKLEELKIELKAKVMAKAKKQAESLLKPLNQQLGKAIFISDLQSNVYPISNKRSRNRSTNGYFNHDEALYDGAINFDTSRIKSQITVFFAIQ